MTRKELHDAWTARPFHPFAIHLPDGRSLFVGHPEFLSISPDGRAFVAWHEGVMHLVDLFMVSDIEFRRRPPRRRRKTA